MKVRQVTLRSTDIFSYKDFSFMNHGGKKTVICLDNVIVQVMESGDLKTFQWMTEVVKYMLITNMNIIPLPLLLHRAEEIKIYWKS